MQLTIQDWAVIGLYLLVLVIIGIAASRRVKDTGEYFLGKRHFGKLLMIAQNFGVGTHAEMPVSLSGAVYTMGVSGIWFQWKNIFATPFYWIMAPVFRRVRRTTTAEMIDDRYGAGMSSIYSLFAFVFFTINIASILKGAAKVLNEVLGSHLGVNTIVLGLASIFILYSFVGGLLASVWSDFVQGALIIVLSFMLIPLGWSLVGGLHGMKQSLPSQSFSLATPKEIGPWSILMLTLNGLIGIMAQPHLMAAVGTGKDERACRSGFFYGSYVKRLCTVGWAIVGLMVAAMIGRGLFGVHALRDPEDAFGFACQRLLSPGFRGLLVASVMGAALASCSALMVDSGALFTQGFYRPRLFPQRSDLHYLWAGRLSGLTAVAIAIVYSIFLIDKVLYSFLLTETMATYVGISVLLGLMWPRANRWGAGSSLLVSLVTNFGLYYLKNERLDYWDPNIFLVSLSAGIVALVVVSHLTPAEPENQISSFFIRLHTPSDMPTEIEMKASARAGDDDKLQHTNPIQPLRVVTPSGCESVLTADASRTLTIVGEPEKNISSDVQLWAAKHGRQSLLVNLLHPRRGALGVGLVSAYREDLKGFVVGSALSAALVGGVWLALKM